MRLRYTGVNPVTFMDARAGECQPGDEFTLPDEDAASFLVRADVEEVKDDGEEPPTDDHADGEPDSEPEPAVTPEVEAEPVVDDQGTTDNS